MGLGRFGGGVGVTRWLVSEGAIVTVTDQADPESLRESIAALEDFEVSWRLGGHDQRDLDVAELVVVNPAVPKRTSSFFAEVVRRQVPWTTEMNLFCERCPAAVVGVTGSYGKSTTCAMLAEVFEAARTAHRLGFRAVHLGGNIGRSLLTELQDIHESDLVVLEMSNAQLEDLPRIQWAPDLAVITNLFPHHLDRYNSFEEYVQAKLNIVHNPGRATPVVVGELHPQAEPLLEAALNEHFGSHRRVGIEPADPPVELRIPGRHNQANAACVLTVAHVMGLDETLVRQALGSFPGLPHRLEFVRTLNGVDYINDSKSTAPAATVVALEALRRPTIAIVGGQKKEVDLTECAKAMSHWCRLVIATGQSGPDFAHALRPPEPSQPASRPGHPRRVDVYVVRNAAEAVSRAAELARPGEVVLFSPGAPSFDQYDNFTHRGRHFVELVQCLPADLHRKRDHGSPSPPGPEGWTS